MSSRRRAAQHRDEKRKARANVKAATIIRLVEEGRMDKRIGIQRLAQIRAEYES